ncbi:MAG: oxidoreductase [Firmicutes bacterium]|nr:oxidoreductase [Bacillota bacterium]
MTKLKLAFYWAASCGGCDVAVLDINEKILDVAALADIYLWPIAMDFKYKDVQALDDGFIDVCFYNGAVRNTEQREIAELLRQKSKVMVAFGSCACFGGIPGLANLYGPQEILDRVYQETPSTVNPERVRPETNWKVKEGRLTLPGFFSAVYPLSDIVQVEYYVPGCPPPVDLILRAVQAIATGKLPPPGTVFGSDKTVCDTCPRKKEEKKVKGFKRPHEVIPEAEKCLLEQGLICLGPATRGGCGARCIEANMPCRGCFGPTDRVLDQGAKMTAALGGMISSRNETEVRAALATIVDPAGTFYRFTLSTSLLKGRVRPVEKGCPPGGIVAGS